MLKAIRRLLATEGYSIPPRLEVPQESIQKLRTAYHEHEGDRTAQESKFQEIVSRIKEKKLAAGRFDEWRHLQSPEDKERFAKAMRPQAPGQYVCFRSNGVVSKIVRIDRGESQEFDDQRDTISEMSSFSAAVYAEIVGPQVQRR